MRAASVGREVTIHDTAIVEDGVQIGDAVVIWDAVHIRSGAALGSRISVGEKTYIAYDVRIGDDVKINAHVYICAGVVVEEMCMISAGVVFTNDMYPRAMNQGLTALETSAPTEDTLRTHVARGATIGANATVGPGLTLGEFSTVSQYCYLCAASHDFEDVSQPLTTAPIVIGRRAWLAADVFVAPGVTVGEGAVVGARSSVCNILPAWTVSYGNPAKPQRKRRITPEDFGEADTRPESPRDQSQGG